MKRMGRAEPKHKIDYVIGEVVNITDGPFKGFDGGISEVDAVKGKLKVPRQHVRPRNSPSNSTACR